MALTLLSVFGFALMVGGLLGLVITRTAFTPFIPSIVFQVAALALMLWARRTFGRRSFHLEADPTAGGLVTTGPYRYIRHPIYAAVCLFAWGAVLGTPAVLTIGLAALATIGALLRIVCEERLLRRRYPDYVAYSRRTKRMIPFVF